MNPWTRTTALHIASLVCSADNAACCSRYIIAWLEAGSSTCNKEHTECQEFAWCPPAFPLSFLQLLSLWQFIFSHLSLSLPLVLIYWNFQYFGLVLACICWKAIDRKRESQSNGWLACFTLERSLLGRIWGRRRNILTLVTVQEKW